MSEQTPSASARDERSEASQIEGGSTLGGFVRLLRHAESPGSVPARRSAAELLGPAIGLAEGGEIGPSVVLDDFHILREIGRGGMGVVYEAEQVSLGRRVALKVLPLAAAIDTRHRQRFQIEAHAAALLHHEHIVPVYGFGCDRDVPYYAMRFIEGHSLADLLRDRRLAEAHDSHAADHAREVARLGLDVCEALDHAHSLGVVHRDIKPSNLLLDTQGHLWVTDFGLARIAQDDAGLTRTGDLVGTLRYMAPELARGENAAADPRSDLYALGVTLYELLTGKPAFSAPTRQALLQRILHDEPVPPRKLAPTVPRDLETVVLRAMAKDPRARYPSARAMGEDLERFLQDLPVRARRPGVGERVGKWVRRHRAAVLAATGVLLVSLSLGTAVLWKLNRSIEAALAARREVDTQLRAALRAEQDSRARLRVSLEQALGSVDRLVAPVLEPGRVNHLHIDAEQRRAADEALAFYHRLGRSFSSDPGMYEVAAKALHRAGIVRLNLGDDKGRDALASASRIYEQHATAHPDFIWLRTDWIETLLDGADCLTARGHADEATRGLRQALPIATGLIGNRDAALPCFRKGLLVPFERLTWALVSPPKPSAEDLQLAVRMAGQMTDWEPRDPRCWRTLALARYHAADWTGAREALDRAMTIDQGGGPLDWFLMASIRHQQGERDQARHWFDRAETHRETPARPQEAARLQLARAEAARLLATPPQHVGFRLEGP